MTTIIHACTLLFLPSSLSPFLFSFFFFNDTATTEIYTLSLHDALPILALSSIVWTQSLIYSVTLLHTSALGDVTQLNLEDRKSTRLNSSHVEISYAVFCLKKKKKKKKRTIFRNRTKRVSCDLDVIYTVC